MSLLTSQWKGKLKRTTNLTRPRPKFKTPRAHPSQREQLEAVHLAHAGTGAASLLPPTFKGKEACAPLGMGSPVSKGAQPQACLFFGVWTAGLRLCRPKPTTTFVAARAGGTLSRDVVLPGLRGQRWNGTEKQRALDRPPAVPHFHTLVSSPHSRGVGPRGGLTRKYASVCIPAAREGGRVAPRCPLTSVQKSVGHTIADNKHSSISQ